MNKITEKSLCLNVKNRWKEEHYYDGKWRSKRDKIIYEKLVELGEQATVDRICEIIGNDSWTTIYCTICDVKMYSGVESKCPEDNSDVYFYFCTECINNLVKCNKE